MKELKKVEIYEEIIQEGIPMKKVDNADSFTFYVSTEQVEGMGRKVGSLVFVPNVSPYRIRIVSDDYDR